MSLLHIRRGSLVAVLACVLAMGPASARGDSVRDLISTGNERFAAGEYAEALAAYEEAARDVDPLVEAELLNNQAAAHFKLGQLDEARELWVRAAGMRDAAFEAAARYNLGNCDYADAQTALGGGDAQKALALLKQARASYRDALQLDPGLASARANLELATQLIEQIEQQQPQSQPSSQPQSQPSSQPQSQPSSQPSSQESREGEQQQQQQQGEQGEDQQQDSENQQDGQEPNPQSQPSEEDQQEQQQPQPESQPAESQPSEAPQSQPAGAESQPAEPMSLSDMSKEEAERLLQLIRDAEKQRRARLRAMERARHTPVDKDW